METLIIRITVRVYRSFWFALGALLGLSEINTELCHWASKLFAKLNRRDPTRGAFMDGYDLTADPICRIFHNESRVI